jgi:glycerol-3-phosphate acyltransferase PlsY
MTKGIDIRDFGSGNVGTMNTRAVLGWPYALAVFSLDAGKGIVAVSLGSYLGTDALVAVLWVVLGHIFPVWLHFRGGKGLATALGAMLMALQWGSILAFCMGWLISYPLLRDVDRANLVGSLAILLYGIWSGPSSWILILAGILALRHVWELLYIKRSK